MENDEITSYKNSQSNVEPLLSTLIKYETSDIRYELCQNPSCRKIWNHDKVSCVCMGDVSTNLIVGEERPSYLRP